MSSEKKLSEADPEIFDAVNKELIRQQNHIELIASENIVSQAVLEAVSYTHLTLPTTLVV